MTDLYYWGSGLSDMWIMEIKDTARFGWLALQDKPFLGWMRNPILPIFIVAAFGAALGFGLAALGRLIRLDDEGNARSSLLWGITIWRRPRVVYWLLAFALFSLPAAYFVATLFTDVSERFEWSLRVFYGDLALPWTALIALLLMRRCVVSDDDSGVSLLSTLALQRPVTWLGLILWIFGAIPSGAFFEFDWVLLFPVGFVLEMIGVQLLIRRDEHPVRWVEMVSWRALSAFCMQGFYMTLICVACLAPFLAFSILNIYLVPAIYQISADQGVPTPILIRYLATVGGHVRSYWWMTLPWLLMPALAVWNARLAWQVAYRRP